MSYDETQRVGGQQPPGQSWGQEPYPAPPLRDGGYGGAPTIGPRQPLGGYPDSVPPAQQTELINVPGRALAWLAATSGPRVGRLYSLSEAGATIGRDSQNEVIIDDPKVSRQHARVRHEKTKDGQDQFYIWDLASSNGTKLNGQPVVKEPLFDNDEIEIGAVTLVFKQVRGPVRAAQAGPATGGPGEQAGGG